jgi:hypothetical protein
MIYLGIDPGPVESAFVWWDSATENVVRLESIQVFNLDPFTMPPLLKMVDHVSIEWVECFGMAVGQEVFRTVAGIGWFANLMADNHGPLRLVPRRVVKMHLCNSMRAKDANVRQALIDRFGPVGTKKQPGKLYGVATHYWAALGVAVYSADVFDPGQFWIEDLRNKAGK